MKPEVTRLSSAHRDEAGESLLPEGDYHFLGMLGVVSRYQELGLGKKLVEATQALVADFPASSGICLDTESPGNVLFYERLGFEIVGEADVADMHTYPCAKESFLGSRRPNWSAATG